MIRLKQILFEQDKAISTLTGAFTPYGKQWYNKIISSTKYKLYVDMGGVLFKKMGADEGGSGDETDYIGAKLWDDIKQYNPTILSATGTADTKNKQNVKTAQVKKYLTPTPPIKFVISGKDKGIEYADENSILIDDSQTNINSWVSKGGKGIKHDPNDIQTTLVQLKRLYGY